MRLDKEREKRLEPLRMQKALEELQKVGVQISYQDKKQIRFFWKGKTVSFFPYSGWHSGQTITDGRGLNNLLKQLKNG